MLALLDNPIWHALTTRQAHLAQRDGDAARFDPAFTLLAGLRAQSADALDALARLLAPDGVVGLFLDAAPAAAGLRVLDDLEIVHMVHTAAAPTAPPAQLVALGPADVPAMIALAVLTRPGPFGPRTIELGDFVGIKRDGVLVAMAGQRMRMDGLIEVSAICTHPDHLGQGHAAALTAHQIARIHAARALPFLHVRADNSRAIGLYEHLGFAERRRFRYLIVRAA